MTVDEVRALYTALSQAVCPEDVFGDPAEGTTAEAHVKKRYRELATKVHPDKFRDAAGELKELVDSTFSALERMKERADAKVTAGTYGNRLIPDLGAESFAIVTRKRTYHLRNTPIAEGELALLYGGVCADANGDADRVVVKVVKESGDNSFMENEVSALETLWESPGAQSKHLPVILDRFTTEGRQRSTVFREIDGLDLHTVHERHPGGIPLKHAIWVLSRTFSALGYAHKRQIVHSNVEPAHIMINGITHNAFLIDWCCAARKGQKFRLLTDHFSPPEALDGKPPIPQSDIYGAVKCFVYILGGDAATGKLPDSIDVRIQRFVRYCLEPRPMSRPNDAWELYHMLRGLRTEVLGQPAYEPFVI